MTQLIQLNESTASNRIVYIWSVLSNGTSPAQNEAGGQPTISVAGVTAWNSAGTLLAVNTSAGEYQVRLGTSDVSVLGPGVLRYSSSSALETSISLMIVGFNPFAALSTFSSGDSVGLKAQTHSGATVGVGNIAPATYSGVTVGINNILAGAYSGVQIGGVTLVGTTTNVTNPVTAGTVTDKTGYGLAAGDYSGATVGINNIAAGSYSGVTIAGVTRVNSSVTIADATYSAVTVRASNITIATGGIVAASFGASAIDAVALATDAGQEIADRILVRSIAGGADSGRTVGEALAVLRNRVMIDGSVLTVYKADDTTSFWTASVATVSANSGIINQVNPQ